MSESEPVDPDEFEELPSSEIEVSLRVGFGMTGSFPMRLADLFFTEQGLYITEYEYLTPLFGLGAGKHRREAAAMERIYEVHGIDEVLLQADTVIWHAYDDIERVTLHDGGRFGRPRLGVYPTTGASHAYRLHDRDGETESLASDLKDALVDPDIEFEQAQGLGYQPRESFARFFH